MKPDAVGGAAAEAVRPPSPPASPWEEADDAALLVAVAAGNRDQPLRELYRRYAGRIHWLGLELLGDRGAAEELVQETFVRLWRNAGSFDPARGAPATFIFTIARRLAIDLWRRRSARPQATAGEAAVPPVEEHAERLLTRLGVRDAMATLSSSHRQVLELSYEGQLTQQEIAAALEIPLGTVKTRSYHALRNLKVALEARGIHG